MRNICGIPSWLGQEFFSTALDNDITKYWCNGAGGKSKLILEPSDCECDI